MTGQVTLPMVWASPETFPVRSPGYVFLGEAINSFGRDSFGESWLGVEFAATVPDVLPPWSFRFNVSSPERKIVAQAREVLKRRRPEYELPTSGFMALSAHTLPQAPFVAPRSISRPIAGPPRRIVVQAKRPLKESPNSSDDAYRLAVEINAEEVAWAEACVSRAYRVGLTVRERAVEGVLATAYRDNASGEMRPIPASWWTLDNWWIRLATCKIDPRHPMTGALNGSGADPSWLFVTSETLARLVAPREDWWPTTGENKKEWTVRVYQVAMARIGQKAIEAKPLSRELAAMWTQATGEDASAPTFESYLQRSAGLIKR